jgi:hypothetical protein
MKIRQAMMDFHGRQREDARHGLQEGNILTTDFTDDTDEKRTAFFSYPCYP